MSLHHLSKKPSALCVVKVIILEALVLISHIQHAVSILDGQDRFEDMFIKVDIRLSHPIDSVKREQK